MYASANETGYAQWGYPLPMVETGPFYVNRAELTTATWMVDYIRNQAGAFSNPKLMLPGIIINGIVYSLFWVILFSIVQTAYDKIRTKNGMVQNSGQLD